MGTVECQWVLEQIGKKNRRHTYLLCLHQHLHLIRLWWHTCLQFQIGQAIGLYWYPFFFPVGLVTNILSFLVMTMKHNRHLSTCVYLSFIAVSDSLKLCIDLYFWSVTNFFTKLATDLHCQLVVYFVTSCSTSSAFEIVLMTADKVIAVTIPHKAKSICTSKRARILSIVNFSVCFVFYVFGSHFTFWAKSTLLPIFW